MSNRLPARPEPHAGVALARDKKEMYLRCKTTPPRPRRHLYDLTPLPSQPGCGNEIKARPGFMHMVVDDIGASERWLINLADLSRLFRGVRARARRPGEWRSQMRGNAVKSVKNNNMLWEWNLMKEKFRAPARK